MRQEEVDDVIVKVLLWLEGVTTQAQNVKGASLTVGGGVIHGLLKNRTGSEQKRYVISVKI
jgi:hypothetical protein